MGEAQSMTAQNENPSGLLAAVAKAIDDDCLIASRASVVVAVSGGMDSVAMLAALRDLAGEPSRQYRLIVAHLNHQLRPDADADAQFVADLAQAAHLPCVVESRDVRAHARLTGQGIEQAARGLRYEFLLDLARRENASCVAVAHHADDNTETILYRIVRGTALRGLCGIPIRRPLLGSEGVELVRPLLRCRRSDIEQFCRDRGLSWRTDTSNADTTYRRNFIRHDLLPMLREKLNPRADEALLRLAAAAAEVDEYMQAQAQTMLLQIGRFVNDGLTLAVGPLQAAPPALQGYILRTALEQLGVPLRMIGTERLSELRDLLGRSEPAAMALPGDFQARRVGDRLVLQRVVSPAQGAQLLEGHPLTRQGTTVLPDGRRISCDLQPFDVAAFKAHLRGLQGKDRAARDAQRVEFLDADQIRGQLYVRSRKPGDDFVPLGCGGHQSVSDFLTNLKLPAETRDAALCVCDDLGIVYLAPLRIDDRVKVTQATSNVLRIEWARADKAPDAQPLQ